MRKLIVLCVLLGVLAGGDVAARSYAESKLDTRARHEAPVGSTVDTSVRGFPFLGRLAVSGKVREVDFHLTDVDAGAVSLARVDVDLRGVHLDRQALLSDRRARLTGIDHGTITVYITEEALSAALRVPMSITSDKVEVTVLSQGFEVEPSIDDDGSLRFSGTGLARALSLRVSRGDTVACRLGAVTKLSGRLRLSCRIEEIPPAFLGAAREGV